MKHIAFVTLSARLARAAGLPAGERILVGDLRDDVSVADLQRLLTARAVEVEVLEDPVSGPVAVVEMTPVDSDKPVVVKNAHVVGKILNAAKPSAPSTTEKPRLAPSTTEAPKPAPSAPVKTKVVTDKDNAAALRKAAAADKAALDEAVTALAEDKTKPQLIKMAKKVKATFSERGTKLEIAREILEVAKV